MAVCIQSQSDRAVAEEVLDDLGMDSTRQEVGRRRVTKIVNAHWRKTLTRRRPMELSAEPGRVQRPAVRLTEDQTAVLPQWSCLQSLGSLAGPRLPQEGRGAVGQRHRPPAPVRLGLHEDQAPAPLALQGSLDHRGACL